MTSDMKSTVEGKYLTFVLGDEEYGIDALKVQGILTMQTVTPMPHAPYYFKGVATVRGQVAPVISARARLGMPEVETTPETCIILVSVAELSLAGIIVDTVRDVIDIKGEEVEAPPDMSNGEGGIIGLAKSGNKVKILLDINALVGDAGSFL